MEVEQITAQPATIRVRINENCFLCLQTRHLNGEGATVISNQSVSGHFDVVLAPDGKKHRRWVGDEFWATPKQVASWNHPNSTRPIVSILGNRSLEAAMGKAELPAAPAPTASIPCPACKAKLPAAAKFCDQCGAAVVPASADATATDVNVVRRRRENAAASSEQSK
jgi:hypothetical protein